MIHTRNASIAFACLLFVLGASPPAAGFPQIAFDREAVDYGPVAYEQMVVHSFRFTNIGTEPLRVTGRFCHDELIMAKVLEGC
ncbi:MAG: hypothetical protein IH975_09970 [Nitrospinae bacterium]|nr:hypothetical protein [Nitrospinota bacterium]